MATSDVRYFLQDLSHTTFSRGCLEGTPNGLSGTQGSKIHFRLWLPFPRFFLSLFPSFFLFLSQRRLETKKVGCLRFFSFFFRPFFLSPSGSAADGKSEQVVGKSETADWLERRGLEPIRRGGRGEGS